MPANKNQRIRCLILDSCFRNTGKKYQIEDLVDAVNEGLAEILPNGGAVSKRMIYNDIIFMESPEGGLVDLVREKDGRKVYYHYRDTNFSIVENPFTEEERKYFQSLIDTLSNFRGLPQLETLQETLSNITLMTTKSCGQHCMEFEENPFVGGLQWLQPLYNAIQSRSAQELTYEPYGKAPQVFRFHPRYLKQYNRRWYVFGVTTEHPMSVSNFPLDRVKSITPIHDAYMSSDIDWQEYFEDVIGVTVPDGEPCDVHFLVHGRTSYYIQSNPIHGSQRTKWIDNETLDVHLYVRINYELRRTLLSYADSITILSPISLKEAHLLQLREAQSHYFSTIAQQLDG